MKLDVQVRGKTVAQLYRERDDYVMKYLPGTAETDFVSLAMPVRTEPWKWPRDLHPFFRQNLPEGYLLNIVREDFGRFLDGTDLSLLALVGGTGIGRVTVTPEGVAPGADLDPLQIEQLLTTEISPARFATLVRQYARSAISGAVPKFIAPDASAASDQLLGKSTFRTSRYIVKGSDDQTPFLGFNEFYSMRVLERLNVAAVAKTRMSADGRVLIVDRFDVDDTRRAGVRARGRLQPARFATPRKVRDFNRGNCKSDACVSAPCDDARAARSARLAFARQLRSAQCRLSREEHRASL